MCCLEKKWMIRLVLLLAVGVYFPSLSFAEIIHLQSGESVEANIIRSEEQYIIIDVNGDALAYFRDEIISIQSQKKNVVLKIADQVSEVSSQNYYSNGQVKFEYFFVDGFVMKKIEFFENGVVKQRTPFQFNRRQGVAKTYYENGSLKAEIVYEKDKKISKKKYHRDGSLLYFYS